MLWFQRIYSTSRCACRRLFSLSNFQLLHIFHSAHLLQLKFIYQNQIRYECWMVESPSNLKDCIDERMMSAECQTSYVRTPNVIYIISNGCCNALQMEWCSPSTTAHNIIKHPMPIVVRHEASCIRHSHTVLYVVEWNHYVPKIILRNDKGKKTLKLFCAAPRTSYRHYSASPHCLPNSIIIIIINAGKCRPVNGQYANMYSWYTLFVHWNWKMNLFVASRYRVFGLTVSWCPHTIPFYEFETKQFSEFKFMANLYELIWLKLWKTKLIEKHKQPMKNIFSPYSFSPFRISILFI